MTIWITHATTESSNHYLFAYAYEPSRKEVIKRVCEIEKAEELQFYFETTSVMIEKTGVTLCRHGEEIMSCACQGFDSCRICNPDIDKPKKTENDYRREDWALIQSLKAENARLRAALEKLSRIDDDTCVGLGCAEFARETLAACDDTEEKKS